MLYENQLALDVKSLEKYAAKLGLKAGTVEMALADTEIEARIEKDFDGGVRSGVNGTPTFFVNGIRYDEDWDYVPFLSALKATLAE